MDKEELDTLLDALFPETAADNASVNVLPSRLPYDPRAGLGYAVKQTEGDKKIMETFRRLDGSEKKSAARNNSESQRTLSSSAVTHTKAHTSLSTPASRELGLRSKQVTRPRTESFQDRLLKKVKK